MYFVYECMMFIIIIIVVVVVIVSPFIGILLYKFMRMCVTQTEAQRSGRSMACYEEEEVGYGQAADFVLPTQILAKSAGARASASVVPPQRHHLYGKVGHI